MRAPFPRDKADYGEGHAQAKLTAWEVVAVRLVLKEDKASSVARVARAFRVSHTTVRDIRDYRYWRSLP